MLPLPLKLPKIRKSFPLTIPYRSPPDVCRMVVIVYRYATRPRLILGTFGIRSYNTCSCVAAFIRRKVSCKELAGICRLLHKSPLAINTGNLLVLRRCRETSRCFLRSGQIISRSPFDELNILPKQFVEKNKGMFLFDFQSVNFRASKKDPSIADICILFYQ